MVETEKAGRDLDAILDRIRKGLEVAGEVLADFTPGMIETRRKEGGDPVTAADLAVNEALHAILPAEGDGWLSEETEDDPSRMEHRVMWAVDPIDGTKEFVMGLPEWCVSIGYVDGGSAVAGGIYNPAAGKKIVGAIGKGVWLNDEPVRATEASGLDGSLVLASRSEVKRGQWDRFQGGSFTITAMGSVAYKMGLVAAGEADATWTLVPKHEWDVAAGVALVKAAGGESRTLQWGVPGFNKEKLLFDGLVAAGPRLIGPIGAFLELAPASK
jgi:myo-inositol-1(or 4)-monophosphatase